MKRKLSAVLLAAGLACSCLATGVFAGETETEAAAPAAEAVSEAASEAESAVPEEIQEAIGEAEEAVSEAEEAMSEAEESMTAAGTEAAEPSSEEAVDMQAQLSTYMQQGIESVLTQLETMSKAQVDELAEGTGSGAAVAMNWQSVRQSLGKHTEVGVPQITTEGNIIRAVSEVKYDGVNDKTKVEVTYEVDQAAQTFSMNWDVNYPLGTLMAQAGMNTVMGIGIVFLTLLFLSWLIGRLHIIPDIVEGRKKKSAEPAKAAAPAPAPAPAPAAEEEEELVDDTELVAVIAAAIAASENTSTDGFVVRSIKKANKKNWQRA